MNFYGVTLKIDQDKNRQLMINLPGTVYKVGIIVTASY